jgi:hypothetical protein
VVTSPAIVGKGVMQAVAEELQPFGEGSGSENASPRTKCLEEGYTKYFLL